MNNNLFQNPLNPQYNPPAFYGNTRSTSGQQMDAIYNSGVRYNSAVPVPHSVPSNISSVQTAFSENKQWKVQGDIANVGFNNWDFKNKGNIRHNNLEKDVLINEIEMVREYPLFIDSKDRDFLRYPSPFSFTVKFKPLQQEENPFISNNFENVKYIKLEKAVLPYYHKTTNNLNGDGSNYVVDNTTTLNDYPYNVLKVAELKGQNDNATGNPVKDSFEVLYFRKQINQNHFYCDGHYIQIYPKDDLGNINRFTIRMEKYTGALPLFTPDLTVPAVLDYKCNCNVDSASIQTPLAAKCPVHYTKHPLYYGFQTQFTFKVGIYEPHFNKKIYD